MDLFVEDVHHVIAERHRQIKQTAAEQARVGEDAEAGGRRCMAQRQQRLDNGGDNVRCREIRRRCEGG
ncbi:MAG TPA: hypothetical protein PLJ78_12660 [Anaerolineae bacterium]|nr:hypothetical protein [Anaerolineae bacterium]